MRRRVALLTGPAGAGKTAVASAIARRADAAHVEEDAVFAMIPLLGRDEKASIVVAEAMVSLVRHFADSGRPVLLEGLMYYRSAVELLLSRLDVCAVLSLDAALATCLRRNARRLPGGIQLEAAEVRALYFAYRHGDATYIDAERPFDEVVEDVHRKLEVVGWPG